MVSASVTRPSLAGGVGHGIRARDHAGAPRLPRAAATDAGRIVSSGNEAIFRNEIKSINKKEKNQ
jgi:hypothetical protein